MDRELLLAVLSLCGTLLGSLAGILTSSKLLDYRIAQLEKKVDRLGSFSEKLPVLEEKLKVASHRLSDLEEVIGV